MSDYRRRLMIQSGGPAPSPLPPGAIPCDLIYSTGYSSFIDTSLAPSSFIVSVETDICWSKTQNDQVVAFGYYISSPVERWNPLSRASSAGAYNVGLGDVDAVASYPSNYARVMRNKIRLAANASGATIETYDMDDTLLDTQTLTFSNTLTTTYGRTIGLLGRKTSATGIASGSFRGGMGRTKIYGDDHFGTLLADYDPCYYNGNFGFWDHISGTHLIGNVPADIFGTGANWNTEGWMPNSRNSNTSSLVGRLETYRGWNTSPMYEIPAGCTTIQFNSGTTGSNYGLFFFDSNKAYKGYYHYNSADRQVSVVAGSTYVRLSVDRAYQNTCYLYDVTNGAYIWKGINV